MATERSDWPKKVEMAGQILVTQTANEERLSAPGLGGSQRVAFSAVGDNCELCASLDGKVFMADSDLARRYNPPLHPNCNCLWVEVGDDEPWDEADQDYMTAEYEKELAGRELLGKATWIDAAPGEGKYEVLRVPAAPRGRDFTFRRELDPKTGEMRSRLTWHRERYELPGLDARTIVDGVADVGERWRPLGSGGGASGPPPVPLAPSGGLPGGRPLGGGGGASGPPVPPSGGPPGGRPPTGPGGPLGGYLPPGDEWKPKYIVSGFDAEQQRLLAEHTVRLAEVPGHPELLTLGDRLLYAESDILIPVPAELEALERRGPLGHLGSIGPYTWHTGPDDFNSPAPEAMQEFLRSVEYRSKKEIAGARQAVHWWSENQYATQERQDAVHELLMNLPPFYGPVLRTIGLPVTHDGMVDLTALEGLKAEPGFVWKTDRALCFGSGRAKAGNLTFAVRSNGYGRSIRGMVSARMRWQDEVVVPKGSIYEVSSVQRVMKDMGGEHVIIYMEELRHGH